MHLALHWGTPVAQLLLQRLPNASVQNSVNTPEACGKLNTHMAHQSDVLREVPQLSFFVLGKGTTLYYFVGQSGRGAFHQPGNAHLRVRLGINCSHSVLTGIERFGAPGKMLNGKLWRHKEHAEFRATRLPAPRGATIHHHMPNAGATTLLDRKSPNNWNVKLETKK